MLPALSRQSRVSGWPSQSHSRNEIWNRQWITACARKTTRQFPSVTSSRTSLTSLWLLLRTWLLRAWLLRAWLLSAWLLLWLWGIHYVCCCQPHDFKHLWIALLHLLIHSRERSITLRHRKVWCPCISSQVMQVVAINMFRYWLNERWYIVAIVKGCKLHTLATCQLSIHVYWGKLLLEAWQNSVADLEIQKGGFSH